MSCLSGRGCWSSVTCRSAPACATLLRVPLRDAPQIGTAGTVTGEQAGDGPRRIRKTSEVVAMQIVKDIVDRGLVEGDRLPLEAAMVREYRVSRASLREALRLLEVQGLISLRPGRG